MINYLIVDVKYQGMRTLEKLGVHNALSDEVGFRGPSGIPQIFRYESTAYTRVVLLSMLTDRKTATGKRTK